MKVLGVRYNEYTNKKGQFKAGYSVWLGKPFYKGEGIECVGGWLDAAIVEASGYIPSVGDEVNVFYNEWQRVCSVVPVKQ